jgi:shikimate kinase
MKIFLIGMPGSGKTTLGKELAAHLMVDFVDLDAEIEAQEQKSIPEIFAQHGEDYFRIVESKLLHNLAAGTTPFVMATGGGAPCFFNGMKAINASGVSIFLDVPVSELVGRVKKNQERPLLRSLDEKTLTEKLQTLRNQRLACYQQATIVVQDHTLDELLRRLKLKAKTDGNNTV